MTDFTFFPKKQERDNPLYFSALGTPVYSNLDISAGRYTDNNGREISFDGFKEDSVLFHVSQQKNIVKTTIQGREGGTVKEYIGEGDFMIRINMILTSGVNGAYPFDRVEILRRILKAPIALQVNSYYLNNLGIYNIVVEDYDLTQEPGGYSQQGVNIQASSDMPIILQISK